ncbi:MAG: chemotaxis protein CheA, partial [Desulfohalobiaceae bacterium]
DTEKLRSKAVEKGLIAAEAELSEKELLQLIFAPGMSTADAVTSVSGRGVGMDVVRRSIESLRGKIELDSTWGTGTTITIKLPLTLAIIEGLQVRVGESFFIIPLSLVEECTEITRSGSDREEGRQLISIRGELVPFVSLRKVFGINGHRPKIEQIVVTEVEGSRVGLKVDDVIGEHQTVIKSLGSVYKHVREISGATIKGDGSVALIVDVRELIRSAVA